MNLAEMFSNETDPVRLAPGDVLFKQGDSGDTMFVLLEGSLDVVVGDKVVEQSTRGDILGEMALIDGSPRAATVIAREPSSLVRLDAQRFQHLLLQHPFAAHVMKVLAARIRHMDRLLAQYKQA